MKQLQWDKLPQQHVLKTLWKDEKPQQEREMLQKLQTDGVWTEIEEDFKAKQLVVNLMGSVFLCSRYKPSTHGGLVRQKRAELKSILDPQTKKHVGMSME
jgi:cytokinesis protein